MPGSHVVEKRGQLGRMCKVERQKPDVYNLRRHRFYRGSGMSEAEMTEHFVHSKPVVLTDAQTGWPAQQKWKLEWIEKHFKLIRVHAELNLRKQQVQNASECSLTVYRCYHV